MLANAVRFRYPSSYYRLVDGCHMPKSFAPVVALSADARSCTSTCAGHAWRILNEQLLARLVARLILGQYRHAQSILTGNPTLSPHTYKAMIERARMQIAEPSDEQARWHRDGWIFQMISWVSLHVGDSSLVVSVPQSQPADKGFDAIALRLQDDEVEAVLICEDKATEHPRKTFKAKVMPEFVDMEAGERDSHIVAETTALLERAGIRDVDGALQKIHWNEVRNYRASISVSDDSRSRYEALFKDYESAVAGSVTRRRGDTFLLSPLREWMNHFCECVQAELLLIPNRDES